jgi:hypothetical protein
MPEAINFVDGRRQKTVHTARIMKSLCVIQHFYLLEVYSKKMNLTNGNKHLFGSLAIFGTTHFYT